MVLVLKLFQMEIKDGDNKIYVCFHSHAQSLASLKNEYNEWAKKHNELIDQQGYSDVDIYNNAINTFNFIFSIEE